MIRHFVILQLLLLSATIRESLADYDGDGPSITGFPGELDDERGQRLKGALRGRQLESIDRLPIAKDRRLQQGNVAHGNPAYYYSQAQPPPPEGYPQYPQYPQYPYPHPEPQYYHSSSKSAKSKSSKGKGKGKGKGLHFPHPGEIPIMDAYFPDSFYEDDDCKLVTFNESFYFMAPIASDPINEDPGNVGSRFFFNNDIMRPDSQVVEGVVLAGTCTRTAAPGLLGTDGAGTCELICYDKAGNWSIATSGYLETVDSDGGMNAGSMVVTGGSGEMVSVIGEFNVVPMDQQGMLSTGDIFTETYAYYVEAAYGLIICPQPYYITSDVTPETGTGT